jgi:hypothetical protein
MIESPQVIRTGRRFTRANAAVMSARRGLRAR